MSIRLIVGEHTNKMSFRGEERRRTKRRKRKRSRGTHKPGDVGGEGELNNSKGGTEAGLYIRAVYNDFARH